MITKNISRLMTILGLTILSLGAISANPPTPTKPIAPTSTEKAATAEQKTHAHIKSFVFAVQPKKGDAYAQRITDAIMTASKKHKVDPYHITATGYVESHFTMESSPQIGIMQITKSTGRMLAKALKKQNGRDYNIRDIEDNIEMGTLYLAMNTPKPRGTVGSRSGTRSHDYHLRYASGKYNGCGTTGGYVSKVMTVYARIKNGTPKTWKGRSGALWRR